MFETGSSGNLYLLENKQEALLIEAGLPIKKIKQHLEFDFSKIKGCLISHEHGDHAKSIRDIAQLGINIYTSYGTLQALNLTGHRFIPVKDKQQFKVANFNVLAFQTEHDAAEPLGFLIQDTFTGKKFLFATDTYYIKYKFKGLHYIAIECNYAETVLQENIENGSVHPSLATRIRRSHFSLENVLDFLQANDLSQLEILYLIHLSDTNSDIELFKKEIRKIYDGKISY